MTFGRREVLLLGALWMAEMTSSFETSMVLAALKKIIGEFHDPAMVGWLITGFLIVGAAMAALVGRLGDLYGRQQVVLTVLVLGVIGSIISANATTFPVLLGGRILQGVTPTILPLAIGLIRENFPEKRVAMSIGLIISGASVGTAAGLLLGGLIVDHFAWRNIFVVSAAFCAISYVLIHFFVPRSTKNGDGASVDWISGIVFAPGVTLVLLYLSGGKTWGWGNPILLALLVAGVLMCIWWWRQSLRSANPLIDIRSLANRSIAVSCGVTALAAAGTMQVSIVFSLLLQMPTWTAIGLGLTATAAGLSKLPSNLSAVFAGPLSGWLSERGGGRTAMIIGGVITLLGWVLVLYDTSSVAIIVTELIIISFGTTMLFAVGPTIVAEAVPIERTSEVTGMLAVVRALFLGIGAQMVATLLASDSVGMNGEFYPSAHAFDLANYAIVGLCVATVLVALVLPQKTMGFAGTGTDK